MDNLDYIRSTMERASAFTAVPGWGNVGIGCTALGAAWIAAGQASEPAFLLVWLAEAVLALSIALWSMKRKARIHQIPLFCPVPAPSSGAPSARPSWQASC